MAFALPLGDKELAIKTSQDGVDFPGVSSVVGIQPTVDRGYLHPVVIIGDFRHDDIPPCQLANVPFLDLDKLESLEGHLTAVIAGADFRFFYFEDHCQIVSEFANPRNVRSKFYTITPAPAPATSETTLASVPCAVQLRPEAFTRALGLVRLETEASCQLFDFLRHGRQLAHRSVLHDPQSGSPPRA